MVGYFLLVAARLSPLENVTGERFDRECRPQHLIPLAQNDTHGVRRVLASHLWDKPPNVLERWEGAHLKVATGVVVSIIALCVGAQGQALRWPTQLQGTRDVEVWGGAVVAQHDGSWAFNTDIWMGGVRYGRILTIPHGQGWLRGNLEWDFGAVPVFLVSQPKAAWGIEVDPIEGRWNFLRTGKSAPYFEMAGGIVVTNSKVPPGDTGTFNVVPKIGVGWQFFTRPQRSLDVSLCAWHLSNAWTAPRNPSINGLQLNFGYHWFKARSVRKTANDGPPQSKGNEKP